MRNLQAWGWLTAGVVALGLNGFYQDGGAAWAHRVAEGIADRTDYVIERVSGRAEQFVAEARMVADREGATPVAMERTRATSCPYSRAVARAQSRMARMQTAVVHFDTMSAREQARMDRWQAEQDRVQARVQAQVDRQMARIACPRVPVTIPAVRVSAVSLRDIDVPEVRIPEVRIPEVRVPEISVPRVRIPAVRVMAPMVSQGGSSGPI